MKMFGRALTLGGSLSLVLSFAGGCGSNTGLAGSSSPTGAAGSVSTDGAVSVSSDAARELGGDGSDGAGPDDMIPAGWVGARALMIQLSACPMGGPYPPPVDVTETGGVIEGAITCIEFRDNQTICGYVADTGATARVLIQPCDLHPTIVSKGSESYNVTFTLPPRADRAVVEVYRRWDFYGATTPNAPVLLGTVPVGVADGGTDGGDDGCFAACSI